MLSIKIRYKNLLNSKDIVSNKDKFLEKIIKLEKDINKENFTFPSFISFVSPKYNNFSYDLIFRAMNILSNDDRTNKSICLAGIIFIYLRDFPHSVFPNINKEIDILYKFVENNLENSIILYSLIDQSSGENFYPTTALDLFINKNDGKNILKLFKTFDNADCDYEDIIIYMGFLYSIRYIEEAKFLLTKCFDFIKDNEDEFENQTKLYNFMNIKQAKQIVYEMFNSNLYDYNFKKVNKFLLNIML